jgi:hypothetical protein
MTGAAYFFCAEPDDGVEVVYQHLLLCLAEGLSALGVRCYANIDFWPLDPERTTFLLQHDPGVTADDCDIVIVSDEWFTRGAPAPPRPRRHDACWIALDREDGSRLRTLAPAFRDFDLILRTHYNRATRYGANFVPWAYGLSERMIAATRDAATAGRRFELLANWRHTRNPHSLRLVVERALLPRIAGVLPLDTAREQPDRPPSDSRSKLWWHETGRRHWPAYYERLGGAAACACFGGYFVTAWPAAKESLTSRAIKRIIGRTGLRTHLVSQWDSWRLWESLAAGCATLHVDFERYGCVLPVMPVNWQHYIGIDLDDVGAAIARIRDEPALVARIGAAGRAWALEHYGPAATARRLLERLALPPGEPARARPLVSALP